MQLVPIIPQPPVGVEDRLDVKGIAAVKPARRVEERTLPPLVSHVREQLPQTASEITQREKRKEIELSERRLFCRRIGHGTLLVELRSAIDRRRRRGRKIDMQVHIDEEV